jgi:hypothetical protein
MFERLAHEDFAYLTTAGRRTGKEHTIEIMVRASRRPSWVRNLKEAPDVRLRIGTQSIRARARILRAGTKEDELARQLLDGKYQGWREGKRLSSWARRALPVAIDLP